MARPRQASQTGLYEDDVVPTLREIVSERVRTLWNGGKGIGGADLLMASVGAGLRAYTRYRHVEYANGDGMTPEVFLREVEGAVLETMLKEIFDLPSAGVAAVDPVTRFYVLVALHVPCGSARCRGSVRVLLPAERRARRSLGDGGRRAGTGREAGYGRTRSHVC